VYGSCIVANVDAIRQGCCEQEFKVFMQCAQKYMVKKK
jgi:hypothetical protein